MLSLRFPDPKVQSSVELSPRVKARFEPSAYSLASFSKHILAPHLDKRMLHHLGETPRYTPW